MIDRRATPATKAVVHLSHVASQVSRQRQKFGHVCRKRRIEPFSPNRRTRYYLGILSYFILLLMRHTKKHRIRYDNMLR